MLGGLYKVTATPPAVGGFYQPFQHVKRRGLDPVAKQEFPVTGKPPTVGTNHRTNR